MIKLGFASGAIHIALGGREMDLVEPRRRVRRWFALGLAIMIATVVLVEAVTAFRVPTWLEALGATGMFCLALGLNSLLLSPNPAFELRLPPPPPRSVGGDPLLRELERLMQDERAYADHDLRIGGLARRVGTPEQHDFWAKRMLERRWGGTMVLTEPDAGSDVGAGTTKAMPVDEENGGFVGQIRQNGAVVRDTPKGSVLNARILWSFAAAHRLLGNDRFRTVAERAYSYCNIQSSFACEPLRLDLSQLPKSANSSLGERKGWVSPSPLICVTS